MRRTRTTLAALTIAAAITMSSAAPALAGGGGGGAICDGFARGDTIRMYDSCFTGTAHLVDPTTAEVTVTNDGEMPHTITAIDGSFDLYLDAGESGTLELPDDAVIPVYCTLHGTTTGGGMAGVLIRDDGASVTPAAAEESAAGADLQPIRATAGEQDSDGLAVVAIVVAGIAAALSLLAVAAAVAVRRATPAR